MNTLYAQILRDKLNVYLQTSRKIQYNITSATEDKHAGLVFQARQSLHVTTGELIHPALDPKNCRETTKRYFDNVMREIYKV